MDAVRILANATDEDVHCKLDQLYSKQDLKQMKSNGQQQILIETREDQNAVLAVSEVELLLMTSSNNILCRI